MDLDNKSDENPDCLENIDHLWPRSLKKGWKPPKGIFKPLSAEQKKEAIRGFEELADRLDNDPEGLRAEIEAEMLKERGVEWFEQHEKFFDRWWGFSMWQLGFPVDD